MRQDSKKVTRDSNEAVKSGKVIKVDFTKKKLAAPLYNLRT